MRKVQVSVKRLYIAVLRFSGTYLRIRDESDFDRESRPASKVKSSMSYDEDRQFLD